MLCGSSGRLARPAAEIELDLGTGAGTLGNWVRKERGEVEGPEL